MTALHPPTPPVALTPGALHRRPPARAELAAVRIHTEVACLVVGAAGDIGGCRMKSLRHGHDRGQRLRVADLDLDARASSLRRAA